MLYLCADFARNTILVHSSHPIALSGTDSVKKMPAKTRFSGIRSCAFSQSCPLSLTSYTDDVPNVESVPLSNSEKLRKVQCMVQIDPRIHFNLLNDTHGKRAFSDQKWQGTLAAYSANKIVAVIASPKSGSTYVSNVIARHCKLPSRRLCYAYASNEHDLYLPALVTAKITGGVSQLHMRATPHNLQLIKAFDVKCIVLTRNIFDTLASFQRDIKKKLSAQIPGQGLLGYSFVWLIPQLLTLSDEQLMDYCIDFYVPWYLNFLASWNQFRNDERICFLRYETLMENKPAAFARIFELLGYDSNVSPDLLARNFLENNKNISATGGKTGYGLDVLTAKQRTAIETKFCYFDKALGKDYMNLEPDGRF